MNCYERIILADFSVNSQLIFVILARCHCPTRQLPLALLPVLALYGSTAFPAMIGRPTSTILADYFFVTPDLLH